MRARSSPARDACPYCARLGRRIVFLRAQITNEYDMSVLNASPSQLVRGVSQGCRQLALRAAAFVLMATLAAPASADPLTLILLKLLRDQIITRTLEAAYD